jgi:hypothetical protein
MRNITTKVTGDTLTIIVKLNAPGTPSKSGKTDVIASTGGNQRIDGTDVYLGLNAYRKTGE